MSRSREQTFQLESPETSVFQSSTTSNIQYRPLAEDLDDLTPPESAVESSNLLDNASEQRISALDEDEEEHVVLEAYSQAPTTMMPGSLPVHPLPISSPTHLPGRSHTIIGSGNEGVFANMAAKPESSQNTPGKIYEEMEPPSYNEAVSEQAPPYFEATVTTTYGEDGEITIDGLPVGTPFIFIVNAIVSMSFDLIGFLLTSLLATSHAAKCGSKLGFGITLLRYGLLLKTRNVEQDMAEQSRYWDPDTTDTPEHIRAQNDGFSYLLMLLAFFIILHANAEFYRAARLRKMFMQSSEANFV